MHQERATCPSPRRQPRSHPSPTPARGSSPTSSSGAVRATKTALGDLFDLTFFLVAAVVHGGAVFVDRSGRRGRRGVPADLAPLPCVCAGRRRACSRGSSTRCSTGARAHEPDRGRPVTREANRPLAHDRATAPSEPGAPGCVLSRHDLTRAGLTQLLDQRQRPRLGRHGTHPAWPRREPRRGRLRPGRPPRRDPERPGRPARRQHPGRGPDPHPRRSHLAETALSMGVADTVPLDTTADALLEALERAAAGHTTTAVA